MCLGVGCWCGGDGGEWRVGRVGRVESGRRRREHVSTLDGLGFGFWVLGFGFWVLGFGCGVWCLVFGVVEVSWASGRQGRAFVFLCWFIMVVVSFRLCCCGLCRGRSLGRGLGLLLW